MTENRIEEKSEYMEIVELSKYLNLKISAIRNMVHLDEIPSFKLGARVMFKRSHMDAWMESKIQYKLDDFLKKKVTSV